MKTSPHWNGSTLLFEAHKVKVVRAERVLLQDIDLAVPFGGCVLIYGENGVGKSTLLRMLAGLRAIEEGHITMPFLPQENAEHTPFIHYIGHKDGLKEALTVNENMHLWISLLGEKHHQTNHTNILERIGLVKVADAPAGFLSAGQRRRLAFGRLLLAPRPLWILDEPATALDSAGLALLSTLVAEHCAQGGGVIAATHAVLDWNPDRIITLSRQKKTAEGIE